MQERIGTHKAKNVGKSNEVSAEDAALNEMNKVIRNKQKEGYVTTDSLDNIPVFKELTDEVTELKKKQ